MIKYYVFLAFALLFTAAGQVLYKYYFKSKRLLYLLFAAFSFCLVPLLNYLALLGLAIDIVYTATAFTFVLVLIAGVYILNEKLNKNQVYGTILITTGIIIYNWQ